MNDVSDALSAAIRTGEVLTIKYYGGSQPGAERQIAPISMEGSKVRARCYSSNAVKIFSIEKIELCPSRLPESEVAWDPAKKDIRRYNSLQELHDAHQRDFESQGWHVQFNTGFLSLHRVWKNGNPLKAPEVSISFEEWIVDAYMDINDDGDLVDVVSPPRKSTRPYCVRAKKHESISYSILDHAAQRFLEIATKIAPSQKII